MKTFLFLLLTYLLASITVISQTSQEPPELKEASELTKSLVQLFKEDKFDEALRLAKRALEIRERLLPRTDPRVATSLANLGDLYMAKRDYDDARKTFERLSQMQEEQFGPNDVKLASTFDRLAALYYLDRKPEKADELYQRALAAREKAFGPENVQVADTLYAMAQFYRFRREYKRALASYKRSLLIYGAARGVTAPEFERASTGLSCLAYESNNDAIFEERKEIYKQFAPELPVAPPAEVINGKAIYLDKPAYPLEARSFRLSGAVIVHVDIDEQGKVIGAKDLCQGLPYLSQTAVKAAFKARFTPTKVSGMPVKVTGVIVYKFFAP
jgi:TonB family protein